MKYEVTLDGVTRVVDVGARAGGGWTVRLDDGPKQEIDGERLGAARWRFNGRSSELVVVGEAAFVLDGHRPVRGEVVDPRTRALATSARGAAGTVATPMPGAVVRVLVAPGDAVSKGQVLVVVEAMKMENEFRAPVDGVVGELRVSAGQAVEAGAVLVVVNPS
jgi:biotin carboxyl carrier protein